MDGMDYDELSSTQKIAAFLIVIGPESAAEVMKHFDSAQIEPIWREMTSLQVIDETMQQKLMAEFSGVVASGMKSALGGVPYAKRTLEKSGGNGELSGMLSRIVPAGQAGEGAEELCRMEAGQIVSLVKAEQPQTIAFVLSCLDTAKAAEVVARLSPELREEVVERLGRMEETPHGIVNKVAENLSRHFDGRNLQQGMCRRGGVKPVADILNALDKEMRKTLLLHIEERNAALGAAIRKKVFSFEDILRFDPADLQRVLREVDLGELAVAMKSARPAHIHTVSRAMSKRAAESFKEEIEMLPPQKTKAVETLQDKIVQIVLKLEEAGEITFDTGGTDHAAL